MQRGLWAKWIRNSDMDVVSVYGRAARSTKDMSVAFTVKGWGA